MFPILHIGPLAIQTPGLALILGLWLGLSLAEKRSSRVGIPADQVGQITLWFLLAGAAAARLGMAARYPAAFFTDWTSWFSPNPGLFDLWTGAFGGGLAAIAYLQRKKIALWPMLDALTPLLAVMGVVLGVSHWASGAAYGAPAAIPWGVELYGEIRHPSQVYETLGAAILLGITLRLGGARSPGMIFLPFAALTAAMHLFLETFRADRALWLGVRQAQLVAWAALAIIFWLMWRQHERRNGI
jgi:prolipoprotein diacylglyceryltransferase